MTTITRRQADILRIVFAAKQLNVRGIADKLGSPNRLSGDLVELIQKRYLHMEREGQEHFYTITEMGRKCLAKYETQTAGASMSSLVEIAKQNPMTAEDMLRFLDEHKTLLTQALAKVGKREREAAESRGGS